LGLIEDRNEFERRFDALPPDQKELAQENARFADLCRYSSDKNMDIPPQVVDQAGRFAGLRLWSVSALCTTPTGHSWNISAMLVKILNSAVTGGLASATA